jgi:hypothetical protein
MDRQQRFDAGARRAVHEVAPASRDGQVTLPSSGMARAAISGRWKPVRIVALFEVPGYLEAQHRAEDRDQYKRAGPTQVSLAEDEHHPPRGQG